MRLTTAFGRGHHVSGAQVHGPNERASGLAFAQYIRQHTSRAYPHTATDKAFLAPMTMQKAVAL
ncbi:MAG TPA: hypothetical protein VMG13_14760, partial [Trebonia sp.]|nr:hypothetical protein [Trebonia sp.]